MIQQEGAATSPALAAECWVQYGGETYPIRHQYAMPAPNSLPSELENGTHDIELILLDRALPKRFLGRPLWDVHLPEQPNLHGLVIEVTAEGELRGVTLLGCEEAPDDLTPSRFSIASSDRQRVVGAAEMRGDQVSYDIRINAEYWKEPGFSEPTPAEAEAAAASVQSVAYRAFVAAVMARDAEAALRTMTERAQQQLPATAEERAMVMQMLADFMPKSLRMLRVSEEGDQAELEVVDDETRTRGTVALRRENGQWKIHTTEWSPGQ